MWCVFFEICFDLVLVYCLIMIVSGVNGIGFNFLVNDGFINFWIILGSFFKL